MQAAGEIEKFNALEGATEYVAPSSWNEGHVAHRLIEAFKVLASMPGRIGPREFGNAWPTMLQEFAELADEEAKMYARDAFAQNMQARYTHEEWQRALEALAWCWKYLDHPQRADAVQLWAFSKASGKSLNRMLRERVRHAKAKAAYAEMIENRDRARRRLPPVAITPQDVCPGRILTRTTLDRHLQPALAALCRRLVKENVPCR